ncbi:phosphotransferase family protein, partial [Streptomyces sparsus]
MRACGADPRHVRLVERVWAGLPARARNADAHNAAQDGTPAAHNGTGRAGPVVALCHGDLHLGQLVRPPSRAERWLLIDVDDLGVGDPAWDLARPAAWYAAGLLPTEDWQRFLGAYLDAGGCAVPPGTDPWAVLDVPARALTAQTAASGLVRAVAEGRPPDEVELVLLDTCLRIAGPGGPAQA